MGDLAILRSFTPGAAGIWVLVAMAVITLIKGWPKLKELQLASDGSLRVDLMGRITALEAEIIELRKALDAKEQQHEAELRIMRHRLNNETHSLDALLLLLEAAPDKLIDNVARIKEMRVNKEHTIALERGATMGGNAG